MSTTPTTPLTDQRTELLREVGYDDGRAGTSLLVDQQIVASESAHPDVEVLPIGQALKTYDWLQDLMFGLIDPDEDEHVQQAAELLNDPVGHFVRVREGAVVTSPIQLFSILESPQGRQFTHNVTVIEAGAQVEMISGAAVPPSVHAGHHISIDECYIREGASCRSVSIERWGANMESHGYARTHLEAGASATTTALQLAPIRHHLANSVTWVERDGRNNDRAVMLAPAGTERVVDSTVHLVGDRAGSESVTRMVSDGGVIVNTATLVGDAPGAHGFVGCDGLKLTDDGHIEAVPALRAVDPTAQLSHEASVGRIAIEKLEYLMATGLDEDAARDLIVQGFVSLELDAVPEAVAELVAETIASAKTGGM